MIFFYNNIILNEEKVIYSKKEVNSKLRLVIPDIEVDVFIYDVDNEYNDVFYNVQMLDSSNHDDKLYFFASHSGSGDNCYFNRLKELEYGDLVYFYVSGEMLVYKIILKYNIIKTGYMEVDYNNKERLYLITCNGYNRQLIVEGILIN